MSYLHKLQKSNTRQDIYIAVDNSSGSWHKNISSEQTGAQSKLSIMMSEPVTVKQQSAIKSYEKIALQPIVDEIGSLMGVYEKI